MKMEVVDVSDAIKGLSTSAIFTAVKQAQYTIKMSLSLSHVTCNYHGQRLQTGRVTDSAHVLLILCCNSKVKQTQSQNTVSCPVICFNTFLFHKIITDMRAKV